MNKEKVVLFVTCRYSLKHVGGIAQWGENMLQYIASRSISNIVHIDSTIRFKPNLSNKLLWRLVSGVLDTTRVFFLLIKNTIIHRPYVAHINTSGSFSLFRVAFYLLCLKIWGVKTVVHCHFGRIPQIVKSKDWEWKVIRFLVNQSKHIIVIDTPSYNALYEFGMHHKVSLIPNPCSSDVEDMARLPILPKKERDFVFIGHVIPSKGVYELVKAFTKIPGNNNLTLIGPYNEVVKKELQEIAQEHQGGSWLNLLGEKPKEYVLKRMSEASALVLPSYTEGFPNVVLEAMAVGCPVLATNVGAIPMMLSSMTGECLGICFSPKSVDSIVDSLSIFLEKTDEEKELISLKNKEKVLKCYTIEKLFYKYLELWLA
jgi:glycosyltransferase involved in cell wall biosynthesis